MKSVPVNTYSTVLQILEAAGHIHPTTGQYMNKYATGNISHFHSGVKGDQWTWVSAAVDSYRFHVVINSQRMRLEEMQVG